MSQRHVEGMQTFCQVHRYWDFCEEDRKYYHAECDQTIQEQKKEIARLKAELAEEKNVVEAKQGTLDTWQRQIRNLQKELAGSENNRLALADALDGMQKTPTETQKALDTLAHEEAAHLVTIRQREKAEDSFTLLACMILGSPDIKFSSLHGFDEIIAECEEKLQERDTENELLKERLTCTDSGTQLASGLYDSRDDLDKSTT